MYRSLCKKSGAVNIPLRTILVLSVSFILLFGGAMLGAGYYLGTHLSGKSVFTQSQPQSVEMDVSAAEELRNWISEERGRLTGAQQDAEDGLDALAMRLAQLQAQMMRIDALGERLVRLAQLDETEFDFTSPPATGGPDDADPGVGQSAIDLLGGMDTLHRVLHQRGEQLTVLEDWLMNNEVKRQSLPSGLPLMTGWVSSGFGGRINPVTGKRQHHDGVDIPGETGSDVLAVAAGVVIRSERVSGYGNIIEIRHADGFSTRYAHNKENLVKEGDRVEKGQVVALLGSSGRTTGPHVHFEVRKDGDAVDPEQYLQAEH